MRLSSFSGELLAIPQKREQSFFPDVKRIPWLRRYKERLKLRDDRVEPALIKYLHCLGRNFERSGVRSDQSNLLGGVVQPTLGLQEACFGQECPWGGRGNLQGAIDEDFCLCETPQVAQ